MTNPAEIAPEEGATSAPDNPAADTDMPALRPEQGEMPFAMVRGEAVTELPKDLYIPPQALEVFLDAFEGPLDLLLYLIRRQNLDILDIDVAQITEQYMRYVELMDAMQFELAAEYLLMAAMLAEIKSRMLLPRSSGVEEYERFKKAAEDLEAMPRLERELWQASAAPPDLRLERPLPEVNMREVLLALGEVLRRAEMYASHQIQMESLSTRERMSQVLETLTQGGFVPFVSLFKPEEGRLGVVVTFLALMELMKESLIELVQTEGFGSIHIKAKSE